MCILAPFVHVWPSELIPLQNMYEIVVCTAARCAFFIISFLKRDIHEKGLFCVVLCCFDFFHVILSHAPSPLIGFLVAIDIVVAGIL